ncbi:MAG: ABC transporter ATP-binding protein [Planctomycetaceae bacterium]|nr:ABC transporter ATP-binding protein [Planctomycetaceae bacterium]
MPDNAPLTDADLQSASWIFEQIAVREGWHADRSRIRRSVDEAAQFVQHEGDPSWHRWMLECGHSLGHVCRVIDGEIHELIRLARDGVVVILRSEDGQEWRAFVVERGRRLRLLEPRGRRSVRFMRPLRLTRQLKSAGFSGVQRCIVIEPTTVESHLGGTTPDSEQTPFARLRRLMKPERTDIWIVVIFALVSGLLGMTTPLAVEALVNTVAFGRFLQPVVVLSIMLLAFLLFQAALKTMQTFVVEIIQRRLFARLAAELSWRLPRARVDAFGDHYPPEMVNRFFDVVTVQKIVASLLLDGLSLALSTVVGMAVLAFYHPWLLAFDLVLVAMMAIIMFVLGRGAVKTSIKESKTKYAMASWLEDLARCRTTFRYDGAAEFALERSDQLIYDYLSARKKHFSVLMRQILAILMIQALASTALLAIGGWLVISGQLSLGQLVAAELIVAVVVGSFVKMGKHMESFYDLMASVDKIGSLLDLPVEHQDGLLTVPGTSGIVARNLTLSGINGHGGLASVSFNAPPGTKMAVVGDSGSGKSLLLDILFGLREPESGVLTVNGVDPRDLRPDILRRRVVMVRDIEIFDGTIAENIHLERTDISIGDVREAIERVELTPTIQSLHEGFNTVLTQSGSPLSGSEIRRLMIARAIAGRPEVVMLDGILDSLPDQQAESILSRILSLGDQTTVLLVTNRPTLAGMMSQQLSLSHDSHASK